MAPNQLENFYVKPFFYRNGGNIRSLSPRPAPKNPKCPSLSTLKGTNKWSAGAHTLLGENFWHIFAIFANCNHCPPPFSFLFHLGQLNTLT